MAILNVICTLQHRETKWFRFGSLSFTAFTLCAFYTQVHQWVLNDDISALYDVVPTMSKILWILTIISITVNSVSILRCCRLMLTSDQNLIK